MQRLEVLPVFWPNRRASFDRRLPILKLKAVRHRTTPPSGTPIAPHWGVKNQVTDIAATQQLIGVDMVDLLEEMLFQRAATGIRPVLYVSSDTDLECNMLMLLDDMGDVQWSGTQQQVQKQVGYHMVTN